MSYNRTGGFPITIIMMFILAVVGLLGMAAFIYTVTGT